MRASSVSAQASTISLRDVLLEQCSELLGRACFAAVGSDGSLEEIEQTLHELANEAVRRQLERELQSRADAQGERMLLDGKMFRRHQSGVVRYHSLCGDLAVRRWSYREVGVRNGPTVIPLDLQSGLIGRSTPALSFSVAHGYALGSTRQYESQMKAALRVPPPRATLERLATFIGGCAAQDVRSIEQALREEEVVPDEAHAVVISLDRTSVAMAEERPSNTPPNSPRKPRQKPYQRRPPHPFDVNWRMPYVGGVFLVDANGETLLARRYHATVEEGPSELLDRVLADVIAYRRRRNLEVVVLQDGAPELWNLIRDALKTAGITKRTEILDRFHANERIAAALEILERDSDKRHRLYQRWQRQLDRNPRAAYRITNWLLRAQRSRRNSDALNAHVTYLFGRERQMKYAEYARRGLPIASGVIEGTCKSLVNRRAKGSGQRWKQDGLTSVLTLRALLLSDRLERFWPRFAKRFCAPILNAA